MPKKRKKSRRPVRKPRKNRPHQQNAARAATKPRDKRFERAERLQKDLERNPSLPFGPTARRKGLDPRWVLKHFGSSFYRDSSGRIKPKPKRKTSEITLHMPSAEPGVSIPIVTRRKKERRTVGQWMAALNAAARGDFAKIDAFPRGVMIGGIPLPTDRDEIQQILNAVAEQAAPFEGLYRVIARPS